jgi:hypothetical protein
MPELNNELREIYLEPGELHIAREPATSSTRSSHQASEEISAGNSNSIPGPARWRCAGWKNQS